MKTIVLNVVFLMSFLTCLNFAQAGDTWTIQGHYNMPIDSFCPNCSKSGAMNELYENYSYLIDQGFRKAANSAANSHNCLHLVSYEEAQAPKTTTWGRNIYFKVIATCERY